MRRSQPTNSDDSGETMETETELCEWATLTYRTKAGCLKEITVNPGASILLTVNETVCNLGLGAVDEDWSDGSGVVSRTPQPPHTFADNMTVVISVGRDGDEPAQPDSVARWDVE